MHSDQNKTNEPEAGRLHRSSRGIGNIISLTGFLVAVVPGAIVTLKVLFAADGDIEILALLSKTLNFTSLILPVLYPALGLAIAVLISSIHHYMLNPENRGKVFHAGSDEFTLLERYIFIAWFLLGSICIPAFSFIAGTIIILTTLISISSDLVRTKDTSLPVARIRLIMISCGVAMMIFFSLQSGRLWLPEEHIVIDSQKSQAAYILETSGNFTTILYPNHKASIVANARLRSRELCEPATDLIDRFLNTPLSNLFSHQQKTSPPC